MMISTVVPVEDLWLASKQQGQQQGHGQREQQPDFVSLRSRALALAEALEAAAPLCSTSSASSPSLATDVELLASQIATLPAMDAEDRSVAQHRGDEAWLVAAVADLRARARELSSGNGDGDGNSEAAKATTATANPLSAPRPPPPPPPLSSAGSQRFVRTTLKFFMPGSGSACLASRRLRLELSKRMALAGPAGRVRLGFTAPDNEGDDEEETLFVAPSSSSSSSSVSTPSISSSGSLFLFDGRVTSVYFDEPFSLPALTSRGLRLDGASLVRARFYGKRGGGGRERGGGGGGGAKKEGDGGCSDGNGNGNCDDYGDDGRSSSSCNSDISLASTALSPPTVWLERKVHRDPSVTGQRSFKERVALNGAEAAALVAALRPPPQKKDTSPSPSPSPLSSLAAAALRVALGPGAVPLLRTEAERTAFEGEGGLRVTVDERVRMSPVVVSATGGEGSWLFEEEEEEEGQGEERAKRLLFPFTIVEVKLSGSSDQAMPPWLESLLADPSLQVARAPRFSKALHAMAALSLAGLLPPLPAAAAAALPEVSRALLLAAGGGASSSRAQSASKSRSYSFAEEVHRSMASLPAVATARRTVSFARLPGRDGEGDFVDLEATAATAAAAAPPSSSASLSSSPSSPRPPPSSVFFCAAATSLSSSSFNNNNNGNNNSGLVIAAGESLIAPPKALPPIRTSRKSKSAAASAAFAAVSRAVALLLVQQQQRRRKKGNKKKSSSGSGSGKKQRASPNNSSTSSLPLLPTSFARGALYKVEPKNFWSAERTLLNFVQAALLIMLLAVSLMSSNAGNNGSGGALPSSHSSFSDSDSSHSHPCSTAACRAAKVTGAAVAPAAVLFILYALLVFKRRTRRMTEAARGVGFGGGGGGVQGASATAAATAATATATAVESSFDESRGAVALVAIAVVAGVATIAAAFGGGLF